MKASTWILVIGGVLIGVALAGQFEPIRSWLGGVATIALILGVALAVLGTGQAARERRRK